MSGLNCNPLDEKPMKVAVVGGGVSGLAAFWLLNERSNHNVHLYEKNQYIGGDAHAVPFKGDGEECHVETAFVQFNSFGWPNFHRFLHYADIPLDNAEGTISFTRRTDSSETTWSTWSLWTFFGASITGMYVYIPMSFDAIAKLTKRSLSDVKRWRLLLDIFRFNYQALDLLRDPHKAANLDTNLDEYIIKGGYSKAFKDDYLCPLMAGVLSCPYQSIGSEVPVARIARVMHNMGLLQVWGKPQWECIKGGSVKYVNKIISRAPDRSVFSNTEVTKITRTPEDRWLLETSNGTKEDYDRVILTGPPRALLKVLANSGLSSTLTEEVLGNMTYDEFEIWLHRDDSFLPKDKSLRAAWNATLDDSSSPMIDFKGATLYPGNPIETTFDVNRLQSYPKDKYGLILGTQSPLRPIDPSKVHSKHFFSHPIQDAARYRALTKVPALQSELAQQGISIAGAWMGIGIHESGWTAGLNAAIELGGKMPYPLVPSNRAVKRWGWMEMIVRFFLEVLAFFMLLLFGYLQLSNGGVKYREKSNVH